MFSKWVIEWQLFNAKQSIFQLYNDKNKSPFDDINDNDEVCFILDQQAELMKQQSMGWSFHSEPTSLWSYSLKLSRVAPITNFLVFGSIW